MPTSARILGVLLLPALLLGLLPGPFADFVPAQASATVATQTNQSTAATSPTTSPLAPTDQAPVQVQLDSITPSVATPGTGVLLKGTLTNTGPDSVGVEAVVASTTYQGLDTRPAIQSWADDGELTTPIVAAEDHIGVEIAPGAQVSFYAPIAEDLLDPGFDFATLPLRVEVIELGTEEALPGSEVRTYLPWYSTTPEDFHPIDIAWIAPVTLPGGADLVDPDDARRAAAWTTAIGANSRNEELLEGLAGTSATVMADPAVLEPLDPVASLTEAVVEPGEEPTDEEPTEDTTEQPSGSATEAPTEAPSEAPSAPATEAPTQPGQPGDAPSQSAGDPADASAPTTSLEAPANNPTPTPSPGATATDSPEATDPSTPVQEPAPEETPPTTEDAVQHLTSMLTAIPEDQLWWLPVGDIDTGALLDQAVQASAVAELVGRPPGKPLVAPGRTDIAWPLATTFTDDFIDRLRRVWVQSGDAHGTRGVGNGGLSAAVLPSSALTEGPFTSTAAVTHTSGTVLLGYDERLSGIVATAGVTSPDGATVQRYLAETLAIYQEQPAQDRSLLVAVPRTATIDATTLNRLVTSVDSTPWLADVTAQDLIDAAPATPLSLPGTDLTSTADPFTTYSLPGESPLTTSRATQTEAERGNLLGTCEIVPGAEDACTTWLAALDRQYSARWRQSADQWTDPLETVTALTQEILTGLSINPTTINFFADEGVILITVTNELPLQIEDLRMSVRPGNARLRVLAQPDPITIGPESRATVQFRARAIAAGQVPLVTTLSTPDGTRVGASAETEVRVQPTGAWVYWLLGGVAGAILVLGLVRALRPRDKNTAPDPSVPTSGTDLESP